MCLKSIFAEKNSWIWYFMQWNSQQIITICNISQHFDLKIIQDLDRNFRTWNSSFFNIWWFIQYLCLSFNLFFFHKKTMTYISDKNAKKFIPRLNLEILHAIFIDIVFEIFFLISDMSVVHYYYYFLNLSISNKRCFWYSIIKVYVVL